MTIETTRTETITVTCDNTARDIYRELAEVPTGARLVGFEVDEDAWPNEDFPMRIVLTFEREVPTP